jgi:anionic cell wall polymer biosynthesis LytR-Cps2A-Psr (LCP) family protein
MKNRHLEKRRVLNLQFSLLISFTILILASGFLYSDCDKTKDSCNSHKKDIVKILEAKNNKKDIKKTNGIKKIDIQEAKGEEKNSNNLDNLKTKEKRIENPLIFIIVIFGFVFLYYYFNDKKKKKRNK